MLIERRSHVIELILKEYLQFRRFSNTPKINRCLVAGTKIVEHINKHGDLLKSWM